MSVAWLRHHIVRAREDVAKLEVLLKSKTWEGDHLFARVVGGLRYDLEQATERLDEIERQGAA